MRMQTGIHFWRCSVIIVAGLLGMICSPFPGIGPTETQAQPQPCTLTCPANIIQSNDPNECSAVVNYPPPEGDCAFVVCTPPSGIHFPVGINAINCHAGMSGGANCNFTITVNDNQPPSISCPANITVDNDPGRHGATVNFLLPPASDNCPGLTASCLPSSGAFFPIGTTNATYMAMDTAGNASSCIFTVTVNFVPPPVPTFAEEGMVIMGIFLLGSAIYFIKRRKTT